MNENTIKQVIQKAMQNSQKPTDLLAEVGKLGNTNKPISAGNKSGFFQSLGKGLQKVAPVAAGMIPGVGPIASQLLSTLNDDEWFDEFKSAGASFNELLTTDVDNRIGTSNVFIYPRGAFAHVPIEEPEAGVKDVIFPSMLAFIRQKTNNVLADDIDSYYQVIIASIRLYEIYYTMEKLSQFSMKLPVNIPLVTDLFKSIAPENLNTFIGIKDSLKSYLQSTIRLPYALVEAIRWRFGTMFHSFNTGQPGFVNYYPIITRAEGNSPRLSGMGTPNQFDEAIKMIQQRMIIPAGRAAADIKMAYGDHQIKYDVEAPHYDEKEFNLRANMSSYANTASSTVDVTNFVSTARLIKDSRLASSPAIQASTLSTSIALSSSGGGKIDSLALFPVRRLAISPNLYGLSGTAELNFSMFVAVAVPDRIYGNGVSTLGALGLPLQSVDSNTAKIKPGWTTFTPHMRENKVIAPYGAHTVNAEYNVSISPNSQADSSFGGNIQTGIMRSLGFHENNEVIHYSSYISDNASSPSLRMTIVNNAIAYDLAKIGVSTLQSIQTAALRNLTRGDYKAKRPDIETPTVIKDVVTAGIKSIE